MLNYRRLLVVLIVAALGQATAHAGYTVSITPSIGPNPASLGNPAVAEYYQNALSALSSTAGGLYLPYSVAPGQPYTYAPLAGTQVPIRSITSTQFPSWMAVAPPTGNYSSQYGNNIFFGLTVKNPAGFTLNSLNLSGMSTVTDPQQNLGFSYPGGYSFANGGGGKFLGVTSTGAIVTSSTPDADNVTIVALYGVGSSDSFGVSPPYSGGTNQDIINNQLLAAGAYNYMYNDSYTVAGQQYNATPLEILGVPEPATWTLLGVGAIGLMLRRRFARAKVAA